MLTNKTLDNPVFSSTAGFGGHNGRGGAPSPVLPVEELGGNGVVELMGGAGVMSMYSSSSESYSVIFSYE